MLQRDGIDRRAVATAKRTRARNMAFGSSTVSSKSCNFGKNGGTTRLELRPCRDRERSNQLNYVPNVAVTTVFSFHRGASATTSGLRSAGVSRMSRPCVE